MSLNLTDLINSIPDIKDGFTNKIKQELGMLDEETIRTSVARYNHCKSCPIREGNTCSTSKSAAVVKDFHYNIRNEDRKKGDIVKGCGCSLEKKVLSTYAQCPISKWPN